jgi:hypothetical protein
MKRIISTIHIDERLHKSHTLEDPSLEQNQTSKDGVSCMEINILSYVVVSKSSSHSILSHDTRADTAADSV